MVSPALPEGKAEKDRDYGAAILKAGRHVLPRLGHYCRSPVHWKSGNFFCQRQYRRGGTVGGDGSGIPKATSTPNPADIEGVVPVACCAWQLSCFGARHEHQII